MAKKAGQLIIKQHQPLRYWLTLLVYGVVVAAAGWALYTVGERRAGYNNVELGERVTKLTEYIATVEDQKAKLQEQIAVLERNRQIEQQAVSDVDSTLKALQEEVLELKAEVAFYRGIVAPRESEGGLNIQNFKVERTTDERGFRFKLILTQVAKNDASVRGYVKIEISGIQDGKPVKMPLSEVSGGAIPNLDLRFKYFQTVEGNMVLPPGFAPTNVQVDIVPAGGRGGLSKNFAWEALLS
jgi:hypothetical protein